MKSNALQRLFLIDLFKIVCGFYIVIFHYSFSFVSGIEKLNLESFSFFKYVFLSSQNLFYYSGLFIVATYFFLIGYKKSKFNIKIIIFFLLGHFFTQGSNADSFETIEDFTKVFHWGIYSYLLCTYLLVYSVSRINWMVLMGVSIFLLWTPSYVFTTLVSDLGLEKYQAVISGKISQTETYYGWHLMPWVFYGLLFYSIGLCVDKYKKYFEKFSLKYESIFFLITISAIYFFRGLDNKLGVNYESEIFNKESFEILPIILIPVIVIKLSLMMQINKQSKIKNIIQNFGWAKNFGMAYLLHLLFIAAMVKVNKTHIFNQPIYAEILSIFVFLAAGFYVNEIEKSNIFWKEKVDKFKNFIKKN